MSSLAIMQFLEDTAGLLTVRNGPAGFFADAPWCILLFLDESSVRLVLVIPDGHGEHMVVEEVSTKRADVVELANFISRLARDYSRSVAHMTAVARAADARMTIIDGVCYINDMPVNLRLTGFYVLSRSGPAFYSFTMCDAESEAERLKRFTESL